MTTGGWAFLWFIKILSPGHTFRVAILISAVTEGTNFYYRISSQHYVVTQNANKKKLLYSLPPTTTQFLKPTVKTFLTISW
jgi:hypothetical protein